VPQALPAPQERVGAPAVAWRKSGQQAPVAVVPGTAVPGQLEAGEAPLQTTDAHGVGGVAQAPWIAPHVLSSRHARVGDPCRPFRHRPVVCWPTVVAVHEAPLSLTSPGHCDTAAQTPGTR